jgi:hypothetical protein
VLALSACSSNAGQPAGSLASGPAAPPAPVEPAPVEPTPVEPTPTPAGDPAGEPVAIDAARLHEKCGADDSCPPGLECITYYGIAGARGPQFKTCELRCTKQTKCPDGTSCGVIADGPGQVCR